MKYCPKCGKEVADNDSFCQSCGYNFNQSEQNTSVSNNPGINVNNPYGSSASRNNTVYYSDAAKIATKVFLIISIAGMVISFLTFLIIGIAGRSAINEAAGGADGGLTGSVFVGVAIYLGVCCLIPLAWTIPMTVSIFKKFKNNQPISTGLSVCTLLFVSIIAGIILLVANKGNN